MDIHSSGLTEVGREWSLEMVLVVDVGQIVVD